MCFMKSVRPRSSESGYVLLALMLTMTLILVALSIEAPRIAQQIKRDKEEELIHRGKDYATAVKRFVHKNGGRYPVSIEQLEDTNHIRFLRKKYVDPMTGESDWKLVHLGEAQVNIPTPNPGLSGGGGANPGLGGTGSTNPGLGGNTNPGLGGGTNPAVGGGTTNLGLGGGTNPGLSGGTGGQNQNSLGTLNTSGGNGQTVGGGQIIGVASVNKGQSIKEFNDKDHYNEWYFVYDLRLEQSGGTGVAVGAPRGTGTSAGSSGTPGTAGSSGTPGSTGAPGTQNPAGAPPPPDASGQPTPAGTPAPPPQVPN